MLGIIIKKPQITDVLDVDMISRSMTLTEIYEDDIKFSPIWGDMYLSISVINGTEIKVKQQILSNQESLKSLREWVDLLAEEPEGELIKVSTVVDSIRRMIE